MRKLKKVCLQARLQGASRAPAAFAGREFLPQKLFLHSRPPTAMGAIAWQRTRRNGQCLLNVCKKNSLHGPPTALQPILGEGTSMPECPSRSCQTAALPGDGLRLPSWVGAFSPREGKRSPFMRMEAIRLLLCVLYVRSRATFSVRHHSGVTLSHHQESVRHVPFL